ncbi:GGDEF domain-containing protein [Lysobacter sp. SG-8]|uniref:diguanylate cyclase n=1 Tax=Marilutibacter penaei TaxID=2759900 RepID=A0A7W3U1H6_9GAMM|nr:diguanylate cyclase [Lysobacter penaei]MBB1087178.1 GGDEF domain-containing protein [Lysobacter penaei]
MSLRAWLMGMLAWALFAPPAWAGAIDVSQVNELPLSHQLQVLEDPQHGLDLASAMQSRDFAPPPGDRTNFGFSRSTWWVRIDLGNPTGTPVRLVLRQDYPLIDTIDLWQVQDGQIQGDVATGDRRPFDSRPIGTRDFLFPLEVAPGSTQQVYLRMRTSGSMNIGLSLVDPSTLVEGQDVRQLGFGLYFGGFFVLIAYNIFIFLAVRDRPFSYYLLYVLSYGLYFSIIDGLAFQYFWPGQPAWGNTSLVVMLALTLLFGMRFTRSFLDTPQLTPRLDWVARALEVLSVVAFAGAFLLDYNQIIVPISYLTIAITAMIITMGIIGVLHGSVSARYFMIAWGVLLSAVMVFMAKSFGWLPHNPFTQNAFQIGSLLEMVLLSLALAHRVREINHLSRTDALTQLPNRRTFDEALDREFERHLQRGQPVAVLVADIDHFKQVNDTHGHAFGDKVLRRAAKALADHVGASGGRRMAFRYGGEEFAVLLPGEDGAQARETAEALRRAVEQELAALIPVTISIGGASTGDGTHENHHALFSAADRALYAAKRAGRNRVMFDPV